MRDYTYFQLRAYMFQREHMKTVDFKLQEIVELWGCSEKHTKRKIKKYVDEGKLCYTPGKGRGNISKLTFTSSFQEEVEEKVLKLVEDDKLEEIITLLQLQIPQIWISNVSKEVQSLFGMHTYQQSKDVLRTIMARKLTTLDPLYTAINFETYLIHQLGDSLLKYSPKNDDVQPHLAHHWERDEKGESWTFYLRKGVKFHNGELLTSEDVKYTFRRFMTHYTPHFWLVEDISSIECISPFSIRFNLVRPNLFFPRFVASQHLSILCRKEEFNEHVWIGTGPFQLKRRTENVLILQSFENYFLSRPLLDEIEIYYVPHNTKNVLTYDVEMEPSSFTPVQSEDIEVGFQFLAFNFNKSSIIGDLNFRKAIYKLTNVRKMWIDLNRSNLKEASSYFHWKSSLIEKRTDRIKDLLQISGYQGEELHIYTLNKDSYIEETEWLINEGLKYGLNFKVTLYTLEEFYLPDLNNADLLFMGEVASEDYHLSFMGAFLNQSLIFNRFFQPDDLNHLKISIEYMKQAQQSQEREILIESIENYIKKEYLFIYLYHPIKTKTFHPMIKDIQFESFGYVDLKSLWIK